MKKIFTVFLLFASTGMWAQVSVSKQEQTAPQNPAPNSTVQHPPAPSVRVQTSAPLTLPYDVNDMYMGRKAEFLSSMIVKELPADFPKYKKEWSVKDYNAIVDNYYTTHLDILKENPKQKILLLKQKQ